MHMIKMANLHMMDVLLKIDWTLYVRDTAISLVLVETGQSVAHRR